LNQLGLNFEQYDPLIEEDQVSGEYPEDRALRLAREKAIAVSRNHRSDHDSIVIGSDQVAHMNGDIFPKPGNFDLAFDQLRQCSGNWISFTTAISLVDGKGELLVESTDSFLIKYRQLTDQEIRSYLNKEQPFDCAGSIKAEGRGIALIEDSQGNDINTLYGLPLIMLVDMLNQLKFNVILSWN